MSAESRPPVDEERLFALLADRATQPLSAEEQEELERLLAAAGDIDEEAFDRAAAALDLVFSRSPAEEMPEFLRHRIEASAQTLFDGARAPSTGNPTPRVALPRIAWWNLTPVWPAWMIAAAALLLAMIGWWPRISPRPSVGEARANLIRDAGDALTVAWKSTGDPYAPKVEGDVVWSNRLQRGYLRLRDVPRNDPQTAQLQLWIFDKDRDEKYPVDGGLFDIDRDSGEVIIAIQPKLAIRDPKMFAVTVEKPGGVVVSSREHIIALAQT